MERLLIIGTSTAARNLYKFVRKYKLFEVIGFAVNETYKSIDTYCDEPVYALEKLDGVFDKKVDYIFVAIQWNKLNADRRKVYETLKVGGFRFANIIAPSAVINGVLKGDNCWICENTIIDFGTEIQENVFMKIGSIVADECKVSAHCFIGARSFLAGGVTVGEQSFIGVGTIVFDNVAIGKKCIVGAGTALKRNLPDFTVYKTAAESFVTKTYTEDVIETKLMFSRNIR